MGRTDRPGVLKPRSTVEGGDESVKDRARGGRPAVEAEAEASGFR